jgi:uncharacterized cupin superfamily protein
MHGPTSATVVGPEAGVVELSFGRPRFKLGAAEGSTGLGLIDTPVAPGGGFALPHWHEKLEEAFYVLEGAIDFLAGEEWLTARAGSTVFVPPGCVHAWRNNSTQPARQLVIGSSPDMLELIRELGTTPRERWDEVNARHDTYFAYDSPYFAPARGA